MLELTDKYNNIFVFKDGKLFQIRSRLIEHFNYIAAESFNSSLKEYYKCFGGENLLNEEDIISITDNGRVYIGAYIK